MKQRKAVILEGLVLVLLAGVLISWQVCPSIFMVAMNIESISRHINVSLYYRVLEICTSA